MSPTPTLEFWGLDFETSGTNIARHAPIQLGVSSPYGGEVIAPLIRQTFAPPTISLAPLPIWDSRAAEVHGFTIEDIEHADLDAPAVDTLVADFIKTHSNTTDKTKRIAVGWNVAAFDFAFLRRYFPRVTDTLSYRSVDLNAIVFAMTEAGMPRATGEAWEYDTLKAFVKDVAATVIRADEGVREDLRPEAAWHDAGYDALAALKSFDALKAILRSSHTRPGE